MLHVRQSCGGILAYRLTFVEAFVIVLPTMKRIRIAIIGIGHLGARHLKVYSEIQDQVELIGVCDIQKERTLKLAEHYHVPLHEDYRQLVGKIDAVNICVPTSLHHEIARFFLQNGVHVFIEKPITSTVDQAQELIDLAKQKKRKLQVGHIERFNAAFQSIKHFTHNPLFIECHRLNKFPNRSLDIGVVMDLMIHDIDIVLGLIFSPIRQIHAVGASILTPLEDIASVRLIFENGCVCNLTASRVSEDVMRKIRLFQENTYISLDYVKQEAYIYKNTIIKFSNTASLSKKKNPCAKNWNIFANASGRTKLRSSPARKPKRPLKSPWPSPNKYGTTAKTFHHRSR